MAKVLFMNILYHYWFSPGSRLARIALAEKGEEIELVLELPWNRRHEFMALNPACTVPVLQIKDGPALCGSYAITEYLEEKAQTQNLMGDSPEQRAETRRLLDWFDVKFNEEVSQLIITEKVMKRFLKRGTPEAAAIRCASHNIKGHLKYIEYLTDRRNWLAGDDFSYADICAAAHLSCIDYLGDIPWADFERAKAWYARVKSRPSFRPILSDMIAGLPPAPHYKNLDF